MAQHTGGSLYYGVQTLSTTCPIGPPHWLLLVGLPLVSPREGTYPAPPGHPHFLCLGRVRRWCPSRRKTKNMKPHNAYDIVKYAKDFEKGNTFMKNYGDPQIEMCHIGGFLSEVYDDTRLLNLTVGKPKPGNLTQIHNEVMKKLECIAHAQWHNACIGGYPIPFCCEPDTLHKMYTLEELRTTSVVTAMTASADPVTSGWPAGSEFKESDITDTEGLCDMVEESTDMEMV